MKDQTKVNGFLDSKHIVEPYTTATGEQKNIMSTEQPVTPESSSAFQSREHYAIFSCVHGTISQLQAHDNWEQYSKYLSICTV